MAERTVSVIIPLWNGEAHIEACLSALLDQMSEGRGARGKGRGADNDMSATRNSQLATHNVEIIVVDNASQDGGAALVAERFPTVRLIRSPHNLGFAGGCNAGLRAAAGQVLVLLNQDTQVQPGWLQALVEAVSRPAVGVVGCRALLGDGRTVQHAGAWIEWPLGLSHHHGYGEAADDRWNRARQVDFVTGAAMATRREVLERVGYLDEDFWPGYYEDADFCYRARAAGYQVWYTPDAGLIHREGTAFSDPLFAALVRLRGRLRFCLKHLPPQRFLSEFLPAEQAYRASVLAGEREQYLRLAYLEAIPWAVELLSWRRPAPAATVQAVVDELHRLYTGQPITGERRSLSQLAGRLYPAQPMSASRQGSPELKPFLAPSPLDRWPVLGRVWRSVRLALHGLVIFYVQQRVVEQEHAGRRMAATLARLKADSQAQAARIEALQAELAELRGQV